jgi:hypothetical protein
MSITERDFILRAIQQIGEALARIAGMRRSGRAEAALMEAQQTAAGILGPMASMVEGLDAQSATMLLAQPNKIRAYGLLVAERSAVHDALGDKSAALHDRLRALELLVAWMKMSGNLDDEVRAALEGLRDGS